MHHSIYNEFMRGSPGFLGELQTQLEGLDLETLETVNRTGGLEIRDLMDFLVNPKDYTVDLPHLVDGAVLDNSNISIDAFWRGKDSLLSGETVHCIIVDENAFHHMPNSDMTLLEMQLMKLSWVKHVCLLVSPKAAADALRYSTSVGKSVTVVENYESFCLTPDNRLHVAEGKPTLHSCGQGDLINSLVNSGLFSEFVNAGVRHVIVCEGDNMVGGGHPSIIGQHILTGSPVTVEVTQAKKDDLQGVLCEHAGFNQIVERFRLSPQTQVDDYGLISTGTMVFNLDLDFSNVKWKWHRTRATVNGSIVTQYIRTLNDLTAHFQTRFIEMPRHYCYMPLRDYKAFK